ncbi:MAG TPA: HAD-IA family hydrolase, partial [Spongiibacteraceae bacterium]|nr:HAD-IA family hydrolase [Spongiibacteraceae bacterium]
MTIRLLTFDLDDTLWDFAPVLVRAEAITYAWLQQHVPAVTARFSCDELRDMRLRIAREQPYLAHRVTELRTRGLHLAMQLAGIADHAIENLAEQAFITFLHARHDIELLDDAEQILLGLKQQYQLGAITNGNFDIARAGLDRYFDFAVNAEQLDRAKPHPEPFLHALALAKCEPRECIHIGDDAENDIRGAQRLGMHTIWLNRLGLPWAGENP